MYCRVVNFDEGVYRYGKPQKKINNFSAQRVAAISQEIRSFERPVISMHVNPDGDAWGSALATAIYLKNIGRDPVVVVGEKDKLPAVFQKIIDMTGIKIIREIPSEYDGVIIVDTPCLKNSIIDTAGLRTDVPVIDIDHHEGEMFFTSNEHTLLSNQVASTTELLFEVFDKHKISPEIAESLLLGVLSDTHNLAFLKTPFTKTIMRVLYHIIFPEKAGQEVDEKYLNEKFCELIDITEKDMSFIKEMLNRLGEDNYDKLIGHGKSYQINKVIVHNGPGEEGSIEPDNITNLRKQLAEELGFKKDGADLILIVYYDPQKNIYRGSLSRYNKALNDNLDLRLLVAQFGGGGQAGAVGFDFSKETLSKEEQKKQMAKIVSAIEKAVKG